MAVNCLPLCPEAFGRAATALANGDLVILPTDTVYGICADVRVDAAVRRIYVAKGKGQQNPLQLLFAEAGAMLDDYVDLSAPARTLVESLGPGGWTIITSAKKGWQSPALAGGSTVGFRIPDAPMLRDVIRIVGAPLAASSANRHGGTSPVTCASAVSEVGEYCSVALDGGPTLAGLDSTVIDCSNDEVRIIREGAIDRHTLARILGLEDIPVLRSLRT